MPSEDVVLQATGLSLAYGRQNVLTDVSMQIQEGEFWFCLGPNGEGKTTLLRAILGDVQLRSGQLRLRPDFARRDRIGFVPQRCDLNPALPTTVREFVLLGTVGTRIRHREYRHRLVWAPTRVGLDDMAKRNYWALSGGQRQRALVARALVRQPGLLLLDEPTNGLDLPTADALMQLLANLNKQERMTLVFVTHEIGLAARYGTHAMLLRGGHAVTGPIREVLTPHHLANVYGIGMDVSRDAAGITTIKVHGGGGAS